jgi:hypothetical protein
LVVPSLAAWLELAGQAPSTTVSVSAAQWRLVVAIGGGCAVEHVVRALGLGELGGCRAVKELVEVGLVTIEGPRTDDASGSATPVLSAEAPIPAHDLPAAGLAQPARSATPVEAATRPEVATRASSGLWAADDDAAAPLYAELEHLQDVPDVVFTPVEHDAVDDDEEAAPDLVSYGHPREEPRAGSFFTEATAKSAPAALPDVQDLDGLVNLPTRLATATETAPPGPTTAGDDGLHHGPAGGELAAAGHDLEEVDGDEPLNRGLLLKFLSSVRN